jgi:DNA-binding response OmpR family regulator
MLLRWFCHVIAKKKNTRISNLAYPCKALGRLEETVTTVLVVDDDAALLRLVSLTLRTEELSVETASEAGDALSILGDHHPDLILLDLNMPVIDGKSFYHQARERGYTAPIVICSAYDAVAAQHELGAEAALPKPFDPDDLLDLIRSLIPLDT